jgi:hypothetical protein
MAVGDVSCGAGNSKRAVCLMIAQTANTGAPSLATEGVSNYPGRSLYSADEGACFTGLCALDSTLVIASTAGSGTMAGTFTLWGYMVGPNKWFPIAVNAAAATPNTPVALAETAADEIRYQQQFRDLGHYDRLFLQLASVGGTATAFEAWLATGSEGRN